MYLDRQSPINLSEQIVTDMSERIRTGQLLPGNRLPSIRKLAHSCGVSAATVVTAYDRLTAQGLIEARAASGYFVSRSGVTVPALPGSYNLRSELDGVWLMQKFLQRHPNLVAVGSGFLPESWLEDVLSSRFLAQFARKGKPSYALPCAAEGYPPLRSAIALKLGMAGIRVTPEQILTTIGISQGIDLLCRALLKPGDTVAVEDPSYFGLHAQLRAHGITMQPIPRLESGPDLAALERLCRQQVPRLVFTQTLLHNPTGGSTRPATAFGLLELARRHDFLIVEDDIFGDLHPSPNPLRLAQVDDLQRVIYLGSFSKVLSPALRVGYLAAAPAIVEACLEHKLISVFTTSELDERLVLELLENGGFHKHLERLRGRIAHQRAQAVPGLRSAGLEIALEQEGSLFIWATLPPQVHLPNLLDDAIEHGFLLTPGHVFCLEPAAPQLRFNAAAANDARLFDYLRRYLGPAQQLSQHR